MLGRTRQGLEFSNAITVSINKDHLEGQGGTYPKLHSNATENVGPCTTPVMDRDMNGRKSISLQNDEALGISV